MTKRLALALGLTLAIGWPLTRASAFERVHPPVTTLVVTDVAASGQGGLTLFHYFDEWFGKELDSMGFDAASDSWSNWWVGVAQNVFGDMQRYFMSLTGVGRLTDPDIWLLYPNVNSGHQGIQMAGIDRNDSVTNQPFVTPNFQPMASTTYVDGTGLQRSNVFGISADFTSLMEGYLWQGVWNYWSHGTPPGASGTLTMAPGATAVVSTGPFADLFVFVLDANGTVYDAYDYTNHGWAWQTLGNPGWSNPRAPVAVARRNGTSWRLHVILTARDGNGREHLWERYADYQAGSSERYHWAKWNDIGIIDGGHGVTLTQGVVSYPNGVLHLDIFGSEDGWGDKTCPLGQIIDVIWPNRFGDHWDFTTINPDSECRQYQTMSAAVINNSRVSVYAEDSAGGVWEFAASNSMTSDLATWQETQIW